MKHEKEINDGLLQLRVKAMDIVGFAWDKAVIYGLKGFTGILHRIPSQAALQPRTDQVPMDKQDIS